MVFLKFKLLFVPNLDVLGLSVDMKELVDNLFFSWVEVREEVGLQFLFLFF
jgi:hypothetical protein